MLRSPTITLMLTALAFFLPVDGMADGACFRGKPNSDCRSFWITEAGALYRFAKVKTHDEWFATLMYNWELGLMFNRNTPDAIGATLFLDFDDYLNNVQTGIRLRYRRWLSHRISLDIAPGVVVTGSKVDNMFPSAEILVNAGDFVALTLRLDMRHRRVTGYGGIRFCSYPGVVVGIAGPIIAAAVWASDFNSRRKVRW